jgi:hypothetical protein
MTMTITINDTIADEVTSRIEEYKSGKMETVPHNEMRQRIEGIFSQNQWSKEEE